MATLDLATTKQNKKCVMCGGSGKADCTTCIGSGYRKSHFPEFTKAKCPSCFGKGKIICPLCWSKPKVRIHTIKRHNITIVK